MSAICPILRIKNGPFEGTEYAIRDAFKIGRHPANHLEVADPKASRFHAVIEPFHMGYRIRDLGSHNGTWVNGQRIIESLLNHGDEIQVGQTRMTFALEGEIEPRERDQWLDEPAKGMIDLHCHILPGLDDGPKRMDESIGMCRRAMDDGIRVLVAMPHSLNGIHDNDVETIRRAVRALRGELRKRSYEIEILPGSEIHVNPDIPKMIREGRVETINHSGRAVMVEFPDYMIPDVMARFLESLIHAKLLPVITHPERLPQFQDTDFLREVIEMGSLTQITAMSLTGGFGGRIKSLARSFLEMGLVHVIASDAHSLDDRPPLLSKAMKVAENIIGRQQAWSLVTHNPQAILKGKSPGAVEVRRAEIESSRVPPAVKLPAENGREKLAKPLTIAVISNKGGVGKTHLSINLACALATNGARILLIDADLGNADISNKLDIYPDHHLLDFLNKRHKLQDLVLDTGYGFDLVCGTSGELDLANINYGQRRRFVKHFQKASQGYDFAIFDLSSGIAHTVLDFALAADRTVIVTTPLDLASGYACTKASFHRFKILEQRLEQRLEGYQPQRVFSPYLVINQVTHLEQGLRLFNQINEAVEEMINAREINFRLSPEFLAAIPYDKESVLLAEKHSRPLLLDSPFTKASQYIRHMSSKFHDPDAPYLPMTKPGHSLRRFVAILTQRI